ncbi:Zinc finger C2H2-type [Fusarium oxysporum f. sp. vasinfectum]|uniref:C2H2-type domain-containing protein n=1 Tax=Fusarium oxysporum f. sp. vasinfectum 25433 TaxID=1089449 RepID=X0M752_FUSOX|nr:hypothetical protein FOTG_15226 [Fusarium oxysporum f. sp. vasinfectum 25433]KAK2922388.1 Zinc finger C2H2-type [Fusarium oxysporum f. sp. vasinfectum]
MELVQVVKNEPSARPFQCNWQSCTKDFHRKSDLQRHHRIHTNERPFACLVPGCGKSFNQRTGLTTHTRTHTGEKPYQCQHSPCEKCFSDISSRARHQRIHTGQHRYKCDGCSMRFRKKETLQNHKRKAHQQGITSNDINNCSPDSNDRGPPAASLHSWMTSSPQELVFMDQGAQNGLLDCVPLYADLKSQVQDHQLSRHHSHRSEIPTSVPGKYHGISMHGEQTPTQLVLREETVPQQTYDVSGTGDPGVATMTYTVPPQYQLSQQVQQLPTEHLCLASGTATPVPNSKISKGLYAHESRSQPKSMARESQEVMIQCSKDFQYRMAQSNFPVVFQSQYTQATIGQDPLPRVQQKQEQWLPYHQRINQRYSLWAAISTLW